AVKRIADLVADDRVVVGPGDAIVVDGRILTGTSYLSETSLTGEWRPVPRGPGATVLAGTYVIDGDLEIAPRPGARRVDEILNEGECARVAAKRLQAQADRLMRGFLPVVIGVSVVTFCFWWTRESWSEALFNAMAVLLV